MIYHFLNYVRTYILYIFIDPANLSSSVKNVADVAGIQYNYF